LTKLYVANATRQNVEFTYRLPEMPGVKMQPIPIGGQICVTGDHMLPEQVDSILAQYEKYGLVTVEQMEKSNRKFSGLCYSLDKPVSIDRLRKAMDRNVEELTDRGKQIRKEMAIAANNMIEDDLRENNRPDGLTNLEMTIEEEASKSGDRGTPLVNEGLRVTRTPEGAAPKPLKRNRR